ncbi:ArnT family glycosyltransferase [Zeaxanthinibacter enoshimensis]|uniref:Dolichyl-phosphate-mannose-protein mannosyltransferase n=1 Tax=Zeaxanthinibacter enoshimensis TaxID=392009 RepID=A0A4R6TSJ6_9FLAO|nr:glycosyltransferase family 39 protein [Zeaxanthinibacter enoshimensis]TDQ33153.1 dolichyl-phosphate-mannose-protein mannosyltransferase [Zeaxanthinibacter enoshimensis]
MLKKALERLQPDYQRLSHGSVFTILCLLSFFIRLPFFFRDYIDRDESTFILVAQSWVDGHLPYTELWDLKPPLVYFFFASVIWIFGKSFIAIRMLGVLAVAGTAYFSYRIGKQFNGTKTGVWAGIGTVYLLSLFGSLQGVMSEHLSMLFMVPAIFLLIQPHRWWTVLLSGIMFGLALMTKLNLAYAVFLVGLFFIYETWRSAGWKRAGGSAFLLGAGILLVITATFLPYNLAGQGALWWDSVFMAPLAYSENKKRSLLTFLPLILVMGAFLYAAFKKGWLSSRQPGILLLIMALAGVLFSFMKVGRINGHYLIQFHPLFLVLLAVVASRALPGPRTTIKKAFMVLLILLPAESYLEYVAVTRHKADKGTFYNGEGISVPRWLKEQGLEDESTLFLEYHIGYWLTDQHPPTKSATHPSNICRPELFPFYNNPRDTAMEEIRYLMHSVKPGIVVVRRGKPIFDKTLPEENHYMQTFLDSHYRVIGSVEGADILQRK